MLFPLAQALDGLLQGDLFQPLLIGVFGVADLVHDAGALPGVAVHRVVEGDRVADGLHGEDHVLPGQAQVPGDGLHIRLPAGSGDEPLLGLKHLVGRVPHGAGDPDGAVVPQKAPQLAGDHGHAVGGKLHLLVQVKAVHRFDQADDPHLEQVVHALAPAGELLDHRQHQPEVAGDQLLPGGHIALLRPLYQGSGLRRLQNRQLGGVHTADLNFPLHSLLLSFHLCFPLGMSLLFPGPGNLIPGKNFQRPEQAGKSAKALKKQKKALDKGAKLLYSISALRRQQVAFGRKSCRGHQQYLDCFCVLASL